MKAGRGGHEPAYSVGARRLHWVAIAFGAGFYGVVVLAYLLWRLWLAPESTPNAGVIPPAPRLQAHPGADLVVERTRQESHLGGFAWIDREAGIAQIPIERAMQLLAKQSQQPQPAPQPQQAPAPSTGAAQ